MFCEKCGTKNKSGAKFCEKCGNKMPGKESKGSTKTENSNSLITKFKNLPKKAKIVMGVVGLIIIIAIIALTVLLNNPLKTVEDSLERFYTNYDKDKTKELVEIGKILKSNKSDKKLLGKIEDTTHKITEKWVKNFNKEYKDTDELKTAYQKVAGALKDIYDYYDGLEYMLDDELYTKYRNELSELYSSKGYYLEGKENEGSNDYQAYYYYQKVVESDCYYKKAQDFINNYVKEELSDFIKEAQEITDKLADNATDKEKLDAYVEQINYLRNNKYKNNIDLSVTEDYKKLYSDTESKIVEITKKMVSEYEKDLKYPDAIEVIDNALKDITDSDSDTYKELNELKKTLNDKLPDNLTSKYQVSSKNTSGYNYSRTVDNETYDTMIAFRFEGETDQITYRLNQEYKKLKATIVRGKNWDPDFEGKIVIYGDDKEIYKSDNITKTSELIADIDIDITGVDDLRIEFQTKSEPDGWASFYIYLVEPYLYK